MSAAEKSLRLLVEKWLAPTPSTPVRVTQFGRASSNQRRYVRVEVLRPTGPVGMFFFRHGDGAWCVFPSETERLTMCAY
ncbi:hypothetical protein ABEG10_37645 (plasmid) [Burkholderia cenocepacia]|uniref:Uncharacterized protein n=1 Tax=Burkholderia gladioli TaxID=28095 RepID=A0A2A7SAI6_BURGA|nr:MULTISPECIES: hypothetical protein [Burkholderia]ATF90559.1 hypothetical protein CO712_35535 [Burkholderia gladioli pv. gladioli]MCH7275164.1 hypothetical protein [Burkholderia gladioli]MDC6127280.1 hypothetical protein [Burkholderia gladioli]MDN7500912.1 hypothetical protein [Burkholderia gladioli]MDZ4041835.1 hypothetical protein [Burkholderia gladioli pv. alliicola]